MREAPVRVVRIVEGVRAHLLGKARLALALCFGAAVTAALVLAWVIVAPEGWRQGTPIPLIIDSIFIGIPDEESPLPGDEVSFAIPGRTVVAGETRTGAGDDVHAVGARVVEPQFVVVPGS